MLLVCAEVFKRYILNMPTAWIFDASNMMYGTLFMIGGAYTLAQNGHVRGDFLYSSMRPRTQGVARSGAIFCSSCRVLPRCCMPVGVMPSIPGASTNIPVTADGPPVWQFKFMIRWPARCCCCRARPKSCAA
jgi:TRAP-type mannitol/chloroaromatic compound transport system permease small subunit